MAMHPALEEYLKQMMGTTPEQYDETSRHVIDKARRQGLEITGLNVPPAPPPPVQPQDNYDPEAAPGLPPSEQNGTGGGLPDPTTEQSKWAEPPTPPQPDNYDPAGPNQSVEPDPMQLSSQPLSSQPMRAPVIRPKPQVKSPPGDGIDWSGAEAAAAIDPSKVPQNTSDQPQAKVDNKNLAAAQNALSATADTGDVEKAMERPHAPQDNTRYFAALKQIQQAAAQMAFQDQTHAGDSMQAAMDQEKAKQADFGKEEQDWRSKTTELLKEKFKAKENATDNAREDKKLDLDNRRLDAGEADKKVNEKRLEGQAAQAIERDKETNRHNLAMEARPVGRIQIGIGGPMDRFDEKQVQDYTKNLPDPDTQQAAERLMGRLADKTPINGWESSKGWQSFGAIPVVGGVAQSFGHIAREGTEAEGMYQDLMTTMQGISLKTSGKVLNESEIRNIQSRLGMAAGQSEEALRRAMGNEWGSMNARIQRSYESLTPGARSKVDERHLKPEFKPNPNTGYAPHSAGGSSEQFMDRTLNSIGSIGDGVNNSIDEHIDKALNWVKSQFGSATSGTAVENAKKMADDEEYRKEARKRLGVD